MNYKRELSDEIKNAMENTLSSASRKIKMPGGLGEKQIISSALEDFSSKFASKFELVGPAKIDYPEISIEEAREYLGNFSYNMSSRTILVTKIFYKINYFSNSNVFRKNMEQRIPRNFQIQSSSLSIYLEGKASKENLQKVKTELELFKNNFITILNELNSEIETHKPILIERIENLIKEEKDKSDMQDFFNSL